MTVVVAYWYFLHDFRRPIEALSLHVHAISSTLNVIDVILCANRVSFIGTFYQPLVVAIVYLVFSIILDFACDIRVYPMLNWKKKPTAGAIDAVLCIAVLLIIHFLLCVVKNRSCPCRTRRKAETGDLLNDGAINQKRDERVESLSCS